MKTLLRKIVLGALVFMSYTSSAVESVAPAPEKYRLKKGHSISISDDQGEVIYSGQVNDSGNLISLFDFAQLKNGIYSVEVNKDFIIEITEVKVSQGEAVLLKNSKKEIYKPVFRAENSKVFISKLGLDSNKMTVELYYEDQLIYSDKVIGNPVLSRVYQLDTRLNGNYKAIVRTNNRVYVENFKL